MTQIITRKDSSRNRFKICIISIESTNYFEECSHNQSYNIRGPFWVLYMLNGLRKWLNPMRILIDVSSMYNFRQLCTSQFTTNVQTLLKVYWIPCFCRFWIFNFQFWEANQPSVKRINIEFKSFISVPYIPTWF